jgi:opacity protein-like surface antigen
MKRNRSLIIAAAIAALAIPVLCQAAPVRPGPYFSAFIGAGGVSDAGAATTDFNSVPPTPFNDRVNFDPGINIGATGGYDFGIVRLEGELSYKHGDITSVNSQNAATQSLIRFVNTNGSLGALAAMANTFIDLHSKGPVTPYVGGGFGFAALHLSDTFGTDTGTGQRSIVFFSDDDTVFAYQLGAGLEIPLNRQLSLDLGYRYFATAKANFNSSQIATGFKFESHNGAVGFKVKF